MKMQTRIHRFGISVAVGIVVLSSLQALSAPPSRLQDSKPTTKQGAEKQASDSQEGDGEKKFKQNCSRCHEAPQELSQHISGTVLRHMRVRASLSKQDERDILKFLNP
jgi:hypothetical protein